jgi:hypothetical protein
MMFESYFTTFFLLFMEHYIKTWVLEECSKYSKLREREGWGDVGISKVGGLSGQITISGLFRGKGGPRCITDFN